MRIRTTGKSYAASDSTETNRGAAFRRRHRVGDFISGRVIRVERGDMAWVSFEGEPLLTSIPNSPQPGTVLSFQIQQLLPEIVLKEAPSHHRGSGAGLPSTVQNFYAARAAFEAALDAASSENKTIIDPANTESTRPDTTKDPTMLPVGKREYLAALSPELTTLFNRVQDTVEAINTLLSRANPERLERLAYPPWLAPRAREMELLTIPPAAPPKTGLGKAVLGLRLPPFGVVQIRAMLRPPLIRCRVYAEHPNGATRLAALLLEALPFPDDEWDLQCHGADSLPKRYRGGLPAELLSPLSATFSL